MIRRIFLLLGSLLIVGPPVLAADTRSKDPLPRGPMMKLTNGITNMVTAPAEFWVNYAELEKKYSPMTAFVGGTFYGIFFTAGRVATGAFETLTFPFPFPGNYETIMTPRTAVEAYQNTLKTPSN